MCQSHPEVGRDLGLEVGSRLDGGLGGEDEVRVGGWGCWRRSIWDGRSLAGSRRVRY